MLAPKQFVPGAANGLPNAISWGNCRGTTVLAYATGGSVVILSSSLQVLQIVEGTADDSVVCLKWSPQGGKLAAGVGTCVVLYEPDLERSDSRAVYWKQAQLIDTEHSVKSLSWGGQDLLLAAGSQLSLWQLKPPVTHSPEYHDSAQEKTDTGTSSEKRKQTDQTITPTDKKENTVSYPCCIWRQQCVKDVHYSAYSPDGTYFATAGEYDRLLKIWYRHTSVLPQDKGEPQGTAAPQLRFIYLPHPRSVTSMSWRKEAISQPRPNILLTQSRDWIARLWLETGTSTTPRFSICSVIECAKNTPVSWLYYETNVSCQTQPTKSNKQQTLEKDTTDRKKKKEDCKLKTEPEAPSAKTENDSLNENEFNERHSKLPFEYTHENDYICGVPAQHSSAKDEGSLVIWRVKGNPQQRRQAPSVSMWVQLANVNMYGPGPKLRFIKRKSMKAQQGTNIKEEMEKLKEEKDNMKGDSSTQEEQRNPNAPHQDFQWVDKARAHLLLQSSSQQHSSRSTYSSSVTSSFAKLSSSFLPAAMFPVCLSFSDSTNNERNISALFGGGGGGGGAAGQQRLPSSLFYPSKLNIYLYRMHGAITCKCVDIQGPANTRIDYGPSSRCFGHHSPVQRIIVHPNAVDFPYVFSLDAAKGGILWQAAETAVADPPFVLRDVSVMQKIDLVRWAHTAPIFFAATADGIFVYLVEQKLKKKPAKGKGRTRAKKKRLLTEEESFRLVLPIGVLNHSEGISPTLKDLHVLSADVGINKETNEKEEDEEEIESGGTRYRKKKMEDLLLVGVASHKIYVWSLRINTLHQVRETLAAMMESDVVVVEASSSEVGAENSKVRDMRQRNKFLFRVQPNLFSKKKNVPASIATDASITASSDLAVHHSNVLFGAGGRPIQSGDIVVDTKYFFVHEFRKNEEDDGEHLCCSAVLDGPSTSSTQDVRTSGIGKKNKEDGEEEPKQRSKRLTTFTEVLPYSFLTGSSTGNVRAWKLMKNDETNKNEEGDKEQPLKLLCVAEFKAHAPQAVDSISIAPSNNRFCTTAGNQVRIWELESSAWPQVELEATSSLLLPQPQRQETDDPSSSTPIRAAWLALGDGKALLALGKEDEVKVYNAESSHHNKSYCLPCWKEIALLQLSSFDVQWNSPASSSLSPSSSSSTSSSSSYTEDGNAKRGIARSLGSSGSALLTRKHNNNNNNRKLITCTSLCWKPDGTLFVATSNSQLLVFTKWLKQSISAALPSSSLPSSASSSASSSLTNTPRSSRYDAIFSAGRSNTDQTKKTNICFTTGSRNRNIFNSDELLSNLLQTASHRHSSLPLYHPVVLMEYLMEANFTLVGKILNHLYHSLSSACAKNNNSNCDTQQYNVVERVSVPDLSIIFEHSASSTFSSSSSSSTTSTSTEEAAPSSQATTTSAASALFAPASTSSYSSASSLFASSSTTSPASSLFSSSSLFSRGWGSSATSTTASSLHPTNNASSDSDSDSDDDADDSDMSEEEKQALEERKKEIEAKESALGEFTSEKAEKLAELLTMSSIPAVSGPLQMQLLAIIDTFKQMKDGQGALDHCGVRFTLAVKIFNFMKRSLPLPLRPTSLASKEWAWALHSEAQETLVESVVPKQPSWDMIKGLGLGYWLKNPTTVLSVTENMARAQFSEKKDPCDCALFYLAMGKKSHLVGLFKAVKNEKLFNFFSNNFEGPENERWRTVALKNAYHLLSKQSFWLAAAFFLVAGKSNLSKVLNICLKNLQDTQLALWVCRLVEGEPRDDVLPAMYKQVLEEHVIPMAQAQGDIWLESMGLWLLRRYQDALKVLVDAKGDDSDDKQQKGQGGRSSLRSSASSSPSAVSYANRSSPVAAGLSASSSTTSSPSSSRSQQLSITQKLPSHLDFPQTTIDAQASSSKTSFSASVLYYYRFLKTNKMLRNFTTKSEWDEALQRKSVYTYLHNGSSLHALALLLEESKRWRKSGSIIAAANVPTNEKKQTTTTSSSAMSWKYGWSDSESESDSDSDSENGSGKSEKDKKRIEADANAVNLQLKKEVCLQAIVQYLTTQIEDIKEDNWTICQTQLISNIDCLSRTFYIPKRVIIEALSSYCEHRLHLRTRCALLTHTNFGEAGVTLQRKALFRTAMQIIALPRKAILASHMPSFSDSTLTSTSSSTSVATLSPASIDGGMSPSGTTSAVHIFKAICELYHSLLSYAQDLASFKASPSFSSKASEEEEENDTSKPLALRRAAAANKSREEEAAEQKRFGFEMEVKACVLFGWLMVALSQGNYAALHTILRISVPSSSSTGEGLFYRKMDNVNAIMELIRCIRSQQEQDQKQRRGYDAKFNDERKDGEGEEAEEEEDEEDVWVSTKYSHIKKHIPTKYASNQKQKKKYNKAKVEKNRREVEAFLRAVLKLLVVQTFTDHIATSLVEGYSLFEAQHKHYHHHHHKDSSSSSSSKLERAHEVCTKLGAALLAMLSHWTSHLEHKMKSKATPYVIKQVKECHRQSSSLSSSFDSSSTVEEESKLDPRFSSGILSSEKLSVTTDGEIAATTELPAATLDASASLLSPSSSSPSLTSLEHLSTSTLNETKEEEQLIPSPSLRSSASSMTRSASTPNFNQRLKMKRSLVFNSIKNTVRGSPSSVGEAFSALSSNNSATQSSEGQKFPSFTSSTPVFTSVSRLMKSSGALYSTNQSGSVSLTSSSSSSVTIDVASAAISLPVLWSFIGDQRQVVNAFDRKASFLHSKATKESRPSLKFSQPQVLYRDKDRDIVQSFCVSSNEANIAAATLSGMKEINTLSPSSSSTPSLLLPSSSVSDFYDPSSSSTSASAASSPIFQQRVINKRMIFDVNEHPIHASSSASSATSPSSSNVLQWVEAHPAYPYYLTGGVDGGVYLWQFSNEAALCSYRKAPSPRVMRIHFNASGSKFGACDLEGMLQLWRFHADEDAQHPFFSTRAHTKRTFDFAFLNNGSFLATAGSSVAGPLGRRNVALWDTLLANPKVRSFNCQEGGAYSIVYSPRHQMLISGGKKGDICLFDVRQRVLMSTLKAAHQGTIGCLAISPMENMVASGCSDGSVKLWELGGGNLVERIHWQEAHESRTFLRASGPFFHRPLSTWGVMDLKLTNKRLYSSGADGKVLVRYILSGNEDDEDDDDDDDEEESGEQRAPSPSSVNDVHV